MSDIIGALWVTLGLDATNLEKGMGMAQGSLTKWRDETNSNTMEVARWGAAIAAQAAPFVAAGMAMNEAAQAAARYGDNIEDLARVTLLSQQNVQRLRYATEAAGGDFNSAAGSIAFLAKNLQNATDPTSRQAQALDQLGIRAVKANGEVEDMNTLLPKIIDKLHNMRDRTERMNLTMELFGKNTGEVAKLVEMGAEGIGTYADKAEKLGLIMSDEELARQQQFNDQWAEANMQLELMWIKIGTEVMPIIQQLIPVVEASLPAIQAMADGIGLLTQQFAGLAETAAAAMSAINGDWEGASSHLTNATDIATQNTDELAPTAGVKTGTSISKSKALYESRNSGKVAVQQNNNFYGVTKTQEEVNSLIKGASRALGGPLMGLL